MTPYARLMAEQWPTGTFGHARPTKPPKPPSEPWTAEEQAEHRRTLEDALKRRPPHLRLIHTPQPDAA